jgi:hypothetical protein
LDLGKFNFIRLTFYHLLKEDEKEKDEENAKKVHNALNNITEEKPATETPAEGLPAATGPSMNS